MSPNLIRRLVKTAREAAATGGELVTRRYRPFGQALHSKAPGDFVTEVDLAAEKLLRRRILTEWPDHGMLGEEQPPENLDADLVWILDPIDGTSNFGRGLPTFAVSVACVHRGTPVAAAVHCLPEDATYHAGIGLGAFRERRRLRLRARRLDLKAIVAVQWHRGPREFGYLEELTRTGTRIRNLGCTAAQLCDVAAGRLDANVQEQGKIWDFAAAALLVQEAGGRFTSWDGDPIFPLSGFDGAVHHPSVAAHPAVHRELCALLGPWQKQVVVPPR